MCEVPIQVFPVVSDSKQNALLPISKRDVLGWIELVRVHKNNGSCQLQCRLQLAVRTAAMQASTIS